MSQGGSAGNTGDYALIESVANKLPPAAQEDFRTLMQGWSGQLSTLNTSTGNTPAGNAANVVTPAAPGLSVTGANAAYALTITPPPLTVQATLWYEVSYSAVKGFTSGVTTLQPTQATGMTLNLPGQTLFFRVRCSLNKTAWSGYGTASQSAASSGLVSSAATSDGGAFNQTNLGVVTSVAVGSSAAVQVQGASGPLSSMPTLKGGAQSVLPAATIVGVTPGSSQFVGYANGSYILRPTLGSLLDDGTVPVGKVSVVGTGTPTLPTIVPILSGSSIIGYNVTDGGAGASAPYTLTISGPGTGATTGTQTISGGVLISVAAGNPGTGYDGSTTVTASGGVFPGEEGGGTAEAGNGGRLTNV